MKCTLDERLITHRVLKYVSLEAGCVAHDPHFTAFYRFFGRTDLRKSVSRAKFDAESDFEVRLAVALQKPDQNNEKLILGSKILVENFFSTSKNEMSGIV